MWHNLFMKKFLKILGYIALVIIIFVAVFLGVLYLRYTTQSSEIHSTIGAFIEGVKTGSSDSITPLLHPKFVAPLNDILVKDSRVFTHISDVTERHDYFNYSWKSGVGETTTYQGDVTFSTGEVSDITIKLNKYNGKWVVYSIDISPKADSQK